MVMLLIAVLAFVCILALGYPLANAEQYQFEGGNGDERMEALLSKRRTVFDAIKDLDFDHATGKLTDEDYRQMRGRYEVQAVEVLQKMDALTAAKAKAAGGNGKAATAKSACGKCGANVQSGDRFCPVCGTKLSNLS